MPPKKNVRREITVPKQMCATLDLSAPDLTCGACLLDLFDSLTTDSASSETWIAAIPPCSHLFHFSCLTAWSEQENSCPLCKARFRSIGRYDRLTGARVGAPVQVLEKDFSEAEDYYGDGIDLCEKCKEPGGEEGEVSNFQVLIYCDGMSGTCNASFHVGCVGLSAVPRGKWFCDFCMQRGHTDKKRKPATNLPPPLRETTVNQRPRHSRPRSIVRETVSGHEVIPPPLAPLNRPLPSTAESSSVLPKCFALSAATDRLSEVLQKIDSNGVGAAVFMSRTDLLARIRQNRMQRQGRTISTGITQKPQPVYQQDFLLRNEASYSQI